jgi:hypothetical protein
MRHAVRKRFVSLKRENTTRLANGLKSGDERISGLLAASLLRNFTRTLASQATQTRAGIVYWYECCLTISSGGPDMDGHKQRQLRSLQGRLAGKGDQALREFRDLYEEFNEQQRRQFLDAFLKVAEGNEILEKLPATLHAAIETHWVANGEDGDVIGSGHAELSPKVLLKAIKAWHQGQGYSPGGLGFVY